MNNSRFRSVRSVASGMIVASPLLAFVAACSSSSSDGEATGGGSGAPGTGGMSTTGGVGQSGSGQGGSGQGGASALAGACTPNKRAGAFALTVTPPSGESTGSAQLNGGVYDVADPAYVWTSAQKEGTCDLMVGPKSACAPACDNTQVCDVNKCIPIPISLDVGTVTVTGLKTALNVPPKGSDKKFYYAPISDFPPFGVGDAVTLTATGAGSYAGFTLKGFGFDPLTTNAASFTLEPGKPMTVTWNPPSKPSPATVQISVDIGHHGGISAKIYCDAPDTGSFDVPASLLTKLIEQGVAGFPIVGIMRRTVDSTMVNGQCIEFQIASNKPDGHPMTIPGVSSCNVTEDCPSGKTCQPDRTCK